MNAQHLFSLVLAVSLASQSAVTFASTSPCEITRALSQPETGSLLMFNAHLSHLMYDYGKESFEQRLREIVQASYPTTKVIQVSPFYYEKVANLIDQARLRNSIAKTVGLDSVVWSRFERIMKDITLISSEGVDLLNPLDRTTINLMNGISASLASDVLKAEAIARVSQMHVYLLRWKAFNGEIIEKQAAAEAKKVAVVAVGLVGAGVLCSTLVVSAPIVSAAGAAAAAANLSVNPVTVALLVKLAETAAGAAIGFVGAPAAVIAQSSYKTLSEATKQSANNQTDLSCEISKQTAVWKKTAGDDLLSAALIGASMGMSGGLLTLTTRSAQVVLYATGFGVGVAQLYALGKLGMTAVESLAYYKMAEQAEAEGHHSQALEFLSHARDLAQESGEHGLEAIIIATLSYHVGAHFKHALHEGASAIRQLYAASADTLPTAAKAANEMAKTVLGAPATSQTSYEKP